MPELPEVEVTRRSFANAITGARIEAVVMGKPLRWPLGCDPQLLVGQQVVGLRRRGKYLLLDMEQGLLLVHLGMSGSLRLCDAGTMPEKHDHLDLLLEDGRLLRYRDPRRFGAILWSDDPGRHPLLASLGVEPLTSDFDGACLYQQCNGRTTAIKNLLMDAHQIVGIGNIYANEALFHAGIDPRLAAGRLSQPRCALLTAAVKDTLIRAIAAGGSTLRDFVDGQGKPGYFQQTYFVYGRSGKPCLRCGGPIQQFRQGTRSTFFCPHCQKH